MNRENYAPPPEPALNPRKAVRLNTTITSDAWDQLNALRRDRPKSEFLSELLLRESHYGVPLTQMRDKLRAVCQLLDDRLEDPAKLRSLLREISEQRVGFDKLLEAVARVGSGMDKMELASEQFVGSHKAMLKELEGFASGYRATFQEWLDQVEKRMGVADRAQEHLGTLAQTTDELSQRLKEREEHAATLATEMSKLFADLEDYRDRLGHAVSQVLREEYALFSRRQSVFNWAEFTLLIFNLSGLGVLLWRVFV